jgi:hypothetical protein
VRAIKAAAATDRKAVIGRLRKNRATSVPSKRAGPMVDNQALGKKMPADAANALPAKKVGITLGVENSSPAAIDCEHFAGSSAWITTACNRLNSIILPSHLKLLRS